MCQHASLLQRQVQNDVLELAHIRKNIAELVGSPSYMHYQLASGGLAQKPEVVQGFLDHVRVMHQDHCEQEMQELCKFAHDSRLVKAPKLQVSDYEVCKVHALAACLQQAGLSSRELQFSAAGVLHTLFGVVETLFGVRFVSESADPRFGSRILSLSFVHNSIVCYTCSEYACCLECFGPCRHVLTVSCKLCVGVS